MDHATAVSTSRRGDTEFDLLVLHFVIDVARTTVKTTRYVVVSNVKTSQKTSVV